ncbi:hypothetical protein Tco_1232115, partial [Tanacetum coccineum]
MKMEEAKDRVYLHSIESRRNLKLYKNDSVMIRARCEGKVLVFTMSQGTNDDSQASPSFLDAHDKGDLCPWVLKSNIDDDIDEDFLVDEENEIVEPDVDVRLFGISMYLLFNNIGITNLVSDDVLEGEDVDVINADSFNSDP